MSEESPPLEITEKKHRRPVLILGGLVLLLLGALAYVILFHDGPPPDDAHLVPAWSERGGNANPLAIFCKPLLESPAGDWWQLPPEMREIKLPLGRESREFVASRNVEITAFNALMLTDPQTWQWPDATMMGKYAETYPDSGGSQCHSLSIVLCSQAVQLGEDGKADEAVALCLKIARWAEGLYGAEGLTSHLVATEGIQENALRTLRKVVTTSPTTPAMLQDIIQQARGLRGPQPKHYQQAIKVDYAWSKDCVAHMSRDELIGIGRLPGHFQFLTPRFFKRNQTLSLRLLLDTPVLTALDQDWRAAIPVFAARDEKTNAMYDMDPRLFFLHPNFVGHSPTLHHFSTPRHFPALNRISELTLLLALRLHELEQGTLPTTLDALVPGYLPVVPADIISGTPFLWNAKQQVLYTVGNNGKDDGGSIDAENPESGLDWGVKYSWGHGSISKPSAP